MENATKALLIAAAVLVVIILIAFGMRIVSTSSGTQDQADATMNSTKAQAFNQKFEAYKGNRVNGSTVRNLITAITQNNISDPTHKITMSGTNNAASVKDTSTYKITFTYQDGSGDDAGYINAVTITENASR